MLTASQLYWYQKKCVTLREHQQQHQSIFLLTLRQQSLQPPSTIQLVPGPDFIYPELIVHVGAALKSWLRTQNLLVAIPKPSKPREDPKSYCSIFLLCVPQKIIKRLNHARVNPIIDPMLIAEQAGFRRGRSIVDQAVLLTQNIKDCFETKWSVPCLYI